MKLSFFISKIKFKSALFLSTIIFIFSSLFCYYGDLRTSTIWSVNIWDTLFKTGNILNYYSYSAQNIYHIHAMVGCDFLIYIPWAIWNLPIWALQYFFDITIVDHPIMLLYSKSFLILLVFGCSILFTKIAKNFQSNFDNTSTSIFLFFSSFFTLNSITYFGQNDIIIIFVILLSINSYMKSNFKGFLFWAAISIAFKPFFIFSYVALILLIEKKIHKILLYILSGFSIYFLQKIPFYNAPMYQESLANGPASATFRFLYENTLAITPYMISVFFLSLCITYALAYFDNTDTDKNYKILYYSLLPFICYFLFVRHETYRPLYLFTFIYLIILARPAYQRINIILEMISTTCIIYKFFYTTTILYHGDFILLPGVTNNQKSLNQFVTNLLPNNFLTIDMAVLVTCMLIFAIINHPRFKNNSTAFILPKEPYLLFVRSCIIVSPFILAIILKFI